MSRRAGEAVGELIGLAYDAALDAERWPRFLLRLARALGAVCPGLNVAGPDGYGLGIWFAPEQDPAYLSAYEAYFNRLDPRRPRIQGLAAGSVFVGRRLLDDAELVRLVVSGCAALARESGAEPTVDDRAGTGISRAGGSLTRRASL